MFNLFKEKTSMPIATATKPTPIREEKMVSAIDIHKEFFEESDRLLLLEETNATENFKIEKAKRLARIGVKSNKDMSESHSISQRSWILDKAKYFKEHYPFNKFITHEAVRKVCEKYNLLHRGLDKFTGFFPNKNLIEVENFTLRPEDFEDVYETQTVSRADWTPLSGYHSDYDGKYYNHIKVGTVQPPFEICAPVDQIQLNYNEKIKNGKVVFIDPIVLQRVSGGYLIVTAWGDEASDPEVVNEIKN